MELEISRLSHVPVPFEADVRVRDEEPDAGGTPLRATGIRFPAALRATGSARLDDAVVVVAGRVQGLASLECGRCLGWFAFPVDAAFEARYAPASAHPRVRAEATRARSGGDAEDGIELRPEDLDVSFLPRGATTVSLVDVVREQVLLELPLRPLCKPTCAGLCARCGADLNQGPCGCPEVARDEVDPRLAGLAALRKKLQDG